MDSISFWMYFGITIWSVMLVLGVIIFMSYIVICLNQDTDPDKCY